MSGIQIADAKAPFIMFERRAVEDRAESIAQGRYMAKDVDFVLITPHGSRDQIERVVDDWLQNMETQAKEGRLDPSWYKGYKAAYADWKDGRETPLTGTAINNWPVLSPSQVEMLRGLKVLTVEVLASANEELIKRMGMGGRVLVDKAKDFLATASDKGKVVEEIGDLRGKVESLTRSIEALTQTNQQLNAELAVYRSRENLVAAAPTVEAITAGGLLDDDEKPSRRKL